jgi:hypothetical protein
MDPAIYMLTKGAHVHRAYIHTCSTALGTSPTGGFGTSTTAAASDASACISYQQQQQRKACYKVSVGAAAT